MMQHYDAREEGCDTVNRCDANSEGQGGWVAVMVDHGK